MALFGKKHLDQLIRYKRKIIYNSLSTNDNVNHFNVSKGEINVSRRINQLLPRVKTPDIQSSSIY